MGDLFASSDLPIVQPSPMVHAYKFSIPEVEESKDILRQIVKSRHPELQETLKTHTHACTHTQRHTHTHTQAHMHTHTHTQKHQAADEGVPSVCM